MFTELVINRKAESLAISQFNDIAAATTIALKSMEEVTTKGFVRIASAKAIWQIDLGNEDLGALGRKLRRVLPEDLAGIYFWQIKVINLPNPQLHLTLIDD